MKEGSIRTALGVAVGVLMIFGAGLWGAWLLSKGDRLPDVRLSTLAGRSIGLASLRAGKPLVVNLWATWCPPCRVELPFLAGEQRRRPEITFAFVNEGEDGAKVRRFLDDARLELSNVLLDQGSVLSQEAGVPALPITLFYDPDGHLVDTHLGLLSPGMLSGKLDKLLAREAGRAAN